jgi:hypothetical protein
VYCEFAVSRAVQVPAYPIQTLFCPIASSLIPPHTRTRTDIRTGDESPPDNWIGATISVLQLPDFPALERPSWILEGAHDRILTTCIQARLHRRTPKNSTKALVVTVALLKGTRTTHLTFLPRHTIHLQCRHSFYRDTHDPFEPASCRWTK